MTELNFQLLHQEISLFRNEQIADGTCSPSCGLAITVVHQGHSLYEGTFGLRDREQQLPVTPNTLFSAASLTKAVVATAFMMAHEEGQLDINAPINAGNIYIELKNIEATRRITLRDILSHRTGLPSNDLFWLLESPGLENISRYLKYFDLVSDQQPAFIYNNLLYSVLGEIFADKVGLTLEEFIHQRLFTPLGMTSSVLDFSEITAVGDKAWPYRDGRKLEFRQTDAIRAAGGLYSNLHDMTRWLEFWLNPDLQARIFLHSTLPMRDLLTPQVDVALPLPLIFNGLEWIEGPASYGLGWFIGQAHNQRVVVHPGLIDGFSSAIAFVPETQTGVVVMVNENLSPLPGRFIRKAFELVLGRPQESSQMNSAIASVVDQIQRPVFKPPFMDLAGRYFDPAYGTLEILQVGSGWYMHYGSARTELIFLDMHRAEVRLDVMGLPIPMILTLTETSDRVDKISAPFSLDSRVPERVFTRLE
jgi:CubicO group peptidase (beta-lactamase class C family)